MYRLVLLARLVGVYQQGVVKFRDDVYVRHLEGESAVLYPREIQQFLHHSLKSAGFVSDDRHSLAVGVLVVACLERFAPALYRRQRSSQFELVRHVVEHPGKLAYLVVVPYCDTLRKVTLSKLLRGHAYLHERNADGFDEVHSAAYYQQDNRRAHHDRGKHYRSQLGIHLLHGGYIPQRVVIGAGLRDGDGDGDDVLAVLISVEYPNAVVSLHRHVVVRHVVAFVRGESAAAESDFAASVDGHHLHLLLLVEALDKLPHLGGVVHRHVLVQPGEHRRRGISLGHQVVLRRAVVIHSREVVNADVRNDQKNPDHAERIEHPSSGNGAAQTHAH